MNRTLCHFANTPRLRVMAWLAWLILAVAPVHGMPGQMTGDLPAVAAMSSMTHAVHHAGHAMPGMADDCCTGQGHRGGAPMPGCHCVATCAGVLPVFAMVALFPVFPGTMYVPRHGAGTPSVTRSPPLRPPLLQTFDQT